jgi:subtilisin
MAHTAQPLDLSGEFTGRYLMVTSPGTSSKTIKDVKNISGLNLASSEDFKGQNVGLEALSDGDGVYLSEIGVAIIDNVDDEQIASLSEAKSLSFGVESLDNEQEGAIMEPERVVHVLDEDFGSYLQGYKDAIDHIAAKYAKGTMPGQGELEELEAGIQAIGATYGLKNTKVVVSLPWRQRYTGKNIKVAVLDTGLDLAHPDFAGRIIYSRSFVPGEAVQDRHSHGTHCIGTACGPLNPTDANRDRYGIAYESTIYAGKVLNNAGSGADGWILGGINWAIANKCEVISMSLGALTNAPGYSAAYENAARAALNNGCIIIGAAGNDYSRPVSHPANCPSIMAVAAVNSSNVKADFSNITFYPPHGKVDIAGPGVGTLSSVPMPQKYGTKSGTSMATPHVAGIAALWAQSSGVLRGSALWTKLVSSALAIPQPVNHVGSGLVQAPYSIINLKIPKKVYPIKPIVKKAVIKKAAAKKGSAKKA